MLAAAFSPWWDKHGSSGALDVRRLFMTKDGYRGTRIYCPSGTSTVQQPDGSIKQIPNQEIAMQIVETIRTDGVFALPSEVDANGTPRWKVEESQVSNNPSHILKYPKELDAEILNAMGIADDVLNRPLADQMRPQRTPLPLRLPLSHSLPASPTPTADGQDCPSYR